MDYRNYRGDPFKIPEWLEPYLHLLRYLGIALILIAPIIGWLSVLKIIPRDSWWVLLVYISYPLGVAFFLIGLSFNTTGDR